MHVSDINLQENSGDDSILFHSSSLHFLLPSLLMKANAI